MAPRRMGAGVFADCGALGPGRSNILDVCSRPLPSPLLAVYIPVPIDLVHLPQFSITLIGLVACQDCGHLAECEALKTAHFRAFGVFMSIRRVSILAAFLSLTLTGMAGQDLPLDEILRKNEDALGGAEAIAKVQTLRLATRLVVNATGMQTSMIVQTKRPNLVRTEMVIRGNPLITAYDGRTAWMINPLRGSPEPQTLDASMTAGIASSSMETSIGALAGFRAAGHVVELLGKEEVAGSSAYKVMVTYKSGLTATYFIDAKTFLPVKTIADTSAMGTKMEVEAFPTDYREEGGILFAHSIDQRVGGSSIGHMIYEKIEINVPMDDSIFRIPRAETPIIKK